MTGSRRPRTNVMTRCALLPTSLAALALSGAADADIATSKQNSQDSVAVTDAQQESSAGRFVLVDDQLRARAVNVIEVNPAAVLFDDASGDREAVPLENVLVLMREVGATIGGGTEQFANKEGFVVGSSKSGGAAILGSVLRLTDGRRLVGKYDARLMDDAPENVIRWSHAWLGVIEVPLERIASLAFIGSAEPPAQGAGDVLRLRNGDVLAGFIVGIDDDVAFELDDGTVIDIPVERIEAMTMVNPPADPTGLRLWFDDGTVIGARSVRLGDDRVLRFDGPLLTRLKMNEVDGLSSPRVDLERVEAMEFRPSRLIGLAELDVEEVDRVEPRYVLPRPERVGPPQPAGLDAVAISGPIRVTWRIPAGSERFSTRAVLPEFAATYGSAELILVVDDEEVFRARLDGASRAKEINVPLSGRRLTLTLTSGGDGPVQDIIHLERPMILRGQ